MTNAKPATSSFFLLCLLGALSVISPFAIDMYLPAYVQVAQDFAVPSTTVSLTLSSYFIGLAGGQIFYGPVLDRFGRKKPLCLGLIIFILASFGCALAHNIYVLVAFRFLQALGGCGAQVGSLAMVRDFFPVNQNAKILSRLFLFISVSPLLAPSCGGLVIIWFGWRAVFILLPIIVGAILAIIYFQLPESHKPDTTISLKPLPIIAEYFAIIRHPRFATYALSGAFSFAGLFTYVAGSPIIFMEGFHLSSQIYGGIFASLALGFIVASQLNVVLLRRFDSKSLFRFFLTVQTIACIVFIAGAIGSSYGLSGTMALFFIILSCAGITYPNAAAMAMAPFTKNTGSAAALLGFLQLGVGAVISSGISMSKTHGSLPIIAILAVTSTLGLIILLLGTKKAEAAPPSE